MKHYKMILILAVFISSSVFSQEKERKTAEITIMTSAVCGMCKDRIEHDMAFEKGVKDVNLDLKTKEVSIVYQTKKTDPDKLREAITEIGYDADDLEADAKAYEKLPACCKKDAPPH